MENSHSPEPDTNRPSRGGLQRPRRAVERRRERSRSRAQEQSLISDQRQPEQLSTRAKGSGHRKKTADKWNQ